MKVPEEVCRAWWHPGIEAGVGIDGLIASCFSLLQNDTIYLRHDPHPKKNLQSFYLKPCLTKQPHGCIGRQALRGILPRHLQRNFPAAGFDKPAAKNFSRDKHVEKPRDVACCPVEIPSPSGLFVCRDRELLVNIQSRPQCQTPDSKLQLLLVVSNIVARLCTAIACRQAPTYYNWRRVLQTIRQPKSHRINARKH